MVSEVAVALLDAVEAGQRDRVFATLQHAVHGAVSTSKDWDNWVQEVGRLNPSLLVLLPHTLLDDMDAETLEIGGHSRLRVRKISDSHVRPDNSAPEPVVMLLGCETGLADVPFESFVAAFRRHQAALVVTSLAKVVGRHAAPIAEAFIHELEHVTQNNSLPFGEIALTVRRRLVADGNLSALALAIYGDADWLIASNEDTQPDH